MLAARLAAGTLTLGQAFTFISGLYFRGKLTYARRFAVAPRSASDEPVPAVHVITPNAGLRCPDTVVTADAASCWSFGTLRTFSGKPMFSATVLCG